MKNLVLLADLPSILPRKNGKFLHPSTIYRWHNPGVHGVRLECEYTLAGLATTEAALERFRKRVAAEKERRANRKSHQKESAS